MISASLKKKKSVFIVIFHSVWVLKQENKKETYKSKQKDWVKLNTFNSD